MKEIPHTSFRRAGRWMAVCLALSFALAPGFTRAQTGKAPQPAEPAPRIQFESLEVDLGSIAEGVNPPFKFAFRNEGNADLVIKQVQKTCGCTHAESTKSTLKPGESAEITGEFNTIGRLGKQSKTITVLSNDPKEPSVTLRFVADVKQWIRVEPQFLTFGDVGIGETVTRPITINNQTGSPLRIKGIKSESPLVTARVISPVSETAKGGAAESLPVADEKTPIQIEATLAAGSELVNLHGKLLIETDSPVRPVVEIAFYGRVVGDLLVVPQSVAFGRLDPGILPSSRFLTIRSRSKTPFEIKSVETGGLNITVDSQIMPENQGYRIQLTLNELPATQAQDIRAVVKIETTHPTQKSVEVPVTGIILTSPR